MKILSVSLTEKNLRDLNEIKNSLGKANNSEAIRTAIYNTLQKIEKEKNIKGTINAILIISHSHKTEKLVSKTKHEFREIITTQNHYCTKKDKCIDYFMLYGDGQKIKQMKNVFEKNKEIEKIIFSEI